MLDNFYFQIWFSKEYGLTFDIYPFIQFQIDFAIVAILFGVVVALKIRKAIKNKKRNLINKKIPSDF